MRTASADFFGEAAGRPTGLPRGILLGIGLISVGTLLAEHGFAVQPTVAFWVHVGQTFLAGAYIADRVLLLRKCATWWAAMRQRLIEYGVLFFFLVLALAFTFWPLGAANLLRFLQLEHSRDLVIDIIKLFLLANVLVQLLRLQQRLLVRGARPEWMLAGSFAMLILAGTLLLLLPRASVNSGRALSLMDAFFTATSASCVTGLSIRDTGTEFSLLGQGIILVLIQTGGLGIMTFVAFVAVTSAESLPVPQMLAFRHLVAARTPAILKRQVMAIFGFTALVEAVGAVCLYSFLPADADFLPKLGWSVFHSISAFCNAGFALSSDSLTGVGTNPGMMLTFMALIILGGLGFLVVNDVLGLQISRLPIIRKTPWVRLYNQRVPVYRLPVQTRLSIVATVFLILAGLAGFWILEINNTLAGQTVKNQFWISAFQSVTARTAGFNTVAIEQIEPATLLMMVGLMVIGACPASTGGGIKTVTFAVLLLALRTLITGRERVEIHGRALPQRVLLAALAVFLLYVLAAALGIFGLALCDPEMPFRAQLFEVVSALSTVGLSTGITAKLTEASQLILCVLMFVGRVGPISLLLAVVRMEQPTRFQYPEEDLVVG